LHPSLDWGKLRRGKCSLPIGSQVPLPLGSDTSAVQISGLTTLCGTREILAAYTSMQLLQNRKIQVHPVASALPEFLVVELKVAFVAFKRQRRKNLLNKKHN